MLAQFGILKIHETITNRQWENTGNKYLPIIFFQTTKVPYFEIILASSTDTSSCSYRIMDIDGNAITPSQSVLTATESSYKKVYFNGGTIPLPIPDGYYYIQISIGSLVFYTDVFGWTSDSNILNYNLLKVSISASNIFIGKNNAYELSLSSATLECYLNVVNFNNIEPDVQEDADENNGLTVPYYATMAKSFEWLIWGNSYIYEFLLAIRILCINGTGTITYMGISYEINDSVIEIKETFNGFDTMKISFKIKPSNNILSVKNNV